MNTPDQSKDTMRFLYQTDVNLSNFYAATKKEKKKRNAA